MLPITAIFAVVLTLIAAYLSFRAGTLRAREKVSIGDGGNPQILLEMRRHANFVETVPLALVLMALVELNGGSPALLYGCGVLLVVARIIHPIGLQVGEESLRSPLRGFGAGGTLLSMLILMGALAWGAIA